MTGPAALIAGFDAPFSLDLRFVDVDLRVRTNDETIRARLLAYYRRYVTAHLAAPATEVRLVQGQARPEGLFEDVPREDGRKVKEATREVPGGRLILKRQTGVLMGLGAGLAFAAGDLRTHLNQGINLVNACYARTVAARGHVLFHASAVSGGGRVAMLAGPAGAGKSTIALHLVEDGFRFVSNDRVLARPGPEGVEALGYPKQPRVNPGTLLHHPRLSVLLDERERMTLRSLTQDQLWRLERKYDVDLDAVYGKGTVELRGVLEVLFVLKWRLGGQGLSVRQLATAEALANLPLFRKDLGVFGREQAAPGGDAVERSSPYAAVLERVRVIEVTGGVNFSSLVTVVGELLRK